MLVSRELTACFPSQSIDLTRLPLRPAKTGTAAAQRRGSPGEASQGSGERVEYSSREVKPAVLLLQDLLRAHSLFLLHHGRSLSDLFARIQRARFTALLTWYWDLFLSTWNVLLHGNPACSVLGGIKIAACGELGIGVGEEDRGSGEREVLEGLVGRVEGLVDLVVGRFGEHTAAGSDDRGVKGKDTASEDSDEEDGWLGVGSEVGAEDGAVFLGVGALSRRSLWSITSWMEEIFSWGESAYGVIDILAKAGSRPRRRRATSQRPSTARASPAGDNRREQEQGPYESAKSSAPSASAKDRNNQVAYAKSTQNNTGGGASGMDKIFSYLKLGYGTSWSLGISHSSQRPDTNKEPTTKPANASEGTGSYTTSAKDLRTGYFLVDLDEASEPDHMGSRGNTESTTFRTVVVELEANGRHNSDPNITKDPGSRSEKSSDTGVATTDFSNQTDDGTVCLRPVVYVSRPFIFILLFQTGIKLPAWEELSQALSTHLDPLHKSLLTSTAYRPEKPDLGGSLAATTAQIYDLVFDPRTLTIHSTIPNIPEPVLRGNSNTNAAGPPAPLHPRPWTRVEALNTHTQILNMFASTRADAFALERTCKTSRGWWIVWNRVLEQSTPADAQQQKDGSSLPDLSDAGPGEGDDYQEKKRLAVSKEIFLVRRASDHSGGARGASLSYGVGGGIGMGFGAGSWADGASRLAQGIGVDTKRYIEGLLSLNR